MTAIRSALVIYYCLLQPRVPQPWVLHQVCCIVMCVLGPCVALKYVLILCCYKVYLVLHRNYAAFCVKTEVLRICRWCESYVFVCPLSAVKCFLSAWRNDGCCEVASWLHRLRLASVWQEGEWNRIACACILSLFFYEERIKLSVHQLNICVLVNTSVWSLRFLASTALFSYF